MRANSLIPPLCKGGGGGAGKKGFIVFVVDRCTDFFFSQFLGSVDFVSGFREGFVGDILLRRVSSDVDLC